jgi:hypothetical protein
MPRPRNRAFSLLAGAALALALTGCDRAPVESDAADRRAIGLMTSLPLYWPADAGLEDIAAGRAGMPWQRRAIETRYALVPLDTLSPLPGLFPDDPEVDPLAGIAGLAVIQPRGLSPADNVALDAWVRQGGRLLLILDPALTGEYAAPLGDPRRPVDSALILPVVARWGLGVAFDEAQLPSVTRAAFAGLELPLALSGTIAITDPAAAACRLSAGGAVATCRVGKGRVTLIADAALFEHPELAGENGESITALLAAAFE